MATLLTRPDFDPDRQFRTVRQPDGSLERVNLTPDDLHAAEELRARLDRARTRNAWTPNLTDEERARAFAANRSVRMAWAARRRSRIPRRIARGRHIGRSRSRRSRSSRARARSPDDPAAHTESDKSGSKWARPSRSSDRRSETSRLAENGTAPNSHEFKGRPAARPEHSTALLLVLDGFACPLCGRSFGGREYDAHRVDGHGFRGLDGRRCLRERDLVALGWHRDAGTWRAPMRPEP